MRWWLARGGEVDLDIDPDDAGHDPRYYWSLSTGRKVESAKNQVASAAGPASDSRRAPGAECAGGAEHDA
jgi:hypothetical protein